MNLTGLPKVVLHDHLDGGLRPETVLELADAVGYEGLPASDPVALAAWFDQSGSDSLERYLEAFSETVAVMQTAEALHRVAYEAAVDLAADGVVYAEIRFAPGLHTAGGLPLTEVIEAVVAGAATGERESGIVVRIIVNALRHLDDSEQAARAAIGYADRGVVGFDLAGPEAGFPASRHADACRIARDGGLRLTIHGGEGEGPSSIADALDGCGAERIGHGVRIVEDLDVVDGAVVAFGSVAERVRAGAVPLEVCVASEADTKVYSAAANPVGLLHRNGFNITLNTDNRLMSSTSMSREFELVATHHGFTVDDFRRLTLNAVDGAFCDEDTRAAVRGKVIAGYDAAG